MSIIDRARHALHELDPDGQNAPPWKAVGWQEHGEFDLDTIAYRHGPLPREVAELAALAPELAAEVVRLHEQLGALADELKASWDNAPVIDRFKASGAGMAFHAAIRIRAALEGAEE